MSIAVRPVVWSCVMLFACAGAASAHDDKFEQDREPPYDGPGYRQADGGAPPLDFDSRSLELLSWMPISEFNLEANSVNDCWGYTSPAGREYAIIGFDNGTAFVDITDPTDPQIVAKNWGDESIWQDIKVYGHYAYTATEAERRAIGGIVVYDLEQIDEVGGGVAYVRTINTVGTTTATHNLAIDEVSGFLYRCGGGGSNFSGLRIYDLSDPSQPAFVSSWDDRYVHDAQVVTYTEGLYAGKQVAFCFANDATGGGNPGVDILDVTNKFSIGKVGAINLATGAVIGHPAEFSHQGWLSPDRQYLYFGDEIDEGSGLYPTTTRVIDVSDLSNPRLVATFTNGGTARDHNIYTLDSLIFEANYRSGLRIFDARDPIAPVEIAFFDTYPPDDNARFNGLWSVYPYFPSGTIIGSDIEKGLFVWRFRDCRDLAGSGPDCNDNQLLDSCDLDDGMSSDCNANQIPDECDIAGGLLSDADGDGIPDECCSDDSECNDDNPCTDDTCTGVCVRTIRTGACDDHLYCNGVAVCINGMCMPGDSPCTDPAKPTCDENQDLCVGCVSSLDCDNGTFCDGAEQCIDDQCTQGGDPCPDLTCDEVGDRCFECSGDGECDDGQFCNGVEACNDDGLCRDGSPPCSSARKCDEDRDVCICTGDGSCNDGLFCNGQETCDPATGQCVAGIVPCPPGEECDERTDVCVECLIGLDCTDGNPCTADRCPFGRCTHTPIPGCHDRDRDGVIDELDDCPGTLEEAQVDARGCSCHALDDDDDGVNNCRDACTETPLGESPDKDGCSRSQVASKSPDQPGAGPDGDVDGVLDAFDLCADTPVDELADVDADGCSPAQLQDPGAGQQTPDDSDADGIPDAADRCPGTIVETGAPVDAEGCSPAQRDSDGDGVPDSEDMCGDTADGEAVDGKGCGTAASDGSAGGSGSARPSGGNAAPCGFFNLMILAVMCLGLGAMRFSIHRKRPRP